MDQEQPEIQASYFPEPPPFYKHFTTENLASLKQFKVDNPGNSDDGPPSPCLSASQLLSLPTELRCLVPPEPPAEDDQYRVFGQMTKVHGTEDLKEQMEGLGHLMGIIEPPLEGWEFEQLPSSRPPTPVLGEPPLDASNGKLDRQETLSRLIRSLLIKFLELVGILYSNPTSPQKDEALKDILTFVTNMHALINEYRPHQARETLINMLEMQVERKKTEIAGIKRMSAKVEETLKGFAKNAPNTDGTLALDDAVELSSEDKRRESQRHMWHAMDEILGH
ncbi:mediator of RNA polymerase II transcription subunit 7 [Pleomassaria siparia CBS 279.74]|uniref:Mediator of RNA polymerase II transcription subunit 7 n=1 Tax=Pleomassaria siparia CBS 279.74 TaxID=1314801 RepID=A0A6G1KKP1_9PLEO|nr:mediator of RNA polymerase II transcription subunit 7 [Pleomassaria siparia CBS 279.74]